MPFGDILSNIYGYRSAFVRGLMPMLQDYIHPKSVVVRSEHYGQTTAVSSSLALLASHWHFTRTGLSASAISGDTGKIQWLWPVLSIKWPTPCCRGKCRPLLP